MPPAKIVETWGKKMMGRKLIRTQHYLFIYLVYRYSLLLKLDLNAVEYY